MVWYFHLFQNFPQFTVIHTVKGFGIVHKAEIDVFLELSCFFNDPSVDLKRKHKIDDASVSHLAVFSVYLNVVFPLLCVSLCRKFSILLGHHHIGLGFILRTSFWFNFLC